MSAAEGVPDFAFLLGPGRAWSVKAGEQRAEAAAAIDSLLIVDVSSHGEPAECLLSRLASPQHWTRVCAYGAADRRYLETVGTQSASEQATTYRPPIFWTLSIVPKVHHDATFGTIQLWPSPSTCLREIHHTAIGLVEERLQELAGWWRSVSKSLRVPSAPIVP